MRPLLLAALALLSGCTVLYSKDKALEGRPGSTGSGSSGSTSTSSTGSTSGAGSTSGSAGSAASSSTGSGSIGGTTGACVPVSGFASEVVVAPFQPWTLLLADLDGDGRAQLAAPEPQTLPDGGGRLLLYRAAGAGMAQRGEVVFPEAVLSVTAADLNGDGRVDLAAGTAVPGFTLAYALPDGGFDPSSGSRSSDTGQGRLPVEGIQALALNADASPDLVWGQHDATGVVSSLGPDFASCSLTPLGAGLRALQVAPLRRGGPPVVFGASPEAGVVLDPAAGLAPLYSDPSPLSPSDTHMALVAGDFDGDGLTDFAFSRQNQGELVLYHQLADAGFERLGPVANGASGLAAADLDCDGTPELLVASYPNNTIIALRLQADGGLADAGLVSLNFATAHSPVVLVAGDVDGDGRVDLITSNYDSANVTLRKGQ